MKIFYFLIYLTLMVSISFSQNWEWATTYVHPGAEVVKSIGTDKNNNIYASIEHSYFTGGNCSSCFYYRTLEKFDKNGNHLWTDTLHPRLTDIVVSQEGEVYVQGNWMLAKFDANGQLRWQQYLPNVGIISMALANKGGVIVWGMNILGNSPKYGNINLSGNYRFSMARCDADGNWIWVKENSIGPSSFNQSLIALAPNDQILFSTTAYGNNPYFVMVMDINGNNINNYLKDFYWYYSNTPTNKEPLSPELLSVDKHGNIFLMFTYCYTMVAEICGHTFQDTSTNSKNCNILIAKFNSGGLMEWIKNIKGNVAGQKMLTDTDGSVYLAASGKVREIDTFKVADYSCAGGFVTKIDSAGNLLWFKVAEKIAAFPYASGGFFDIALDAENNIILGGKVGGNIKLGDIITGDDCGGGCYGNLLLAKISQPAANSTVPNNSFGTSFMEVFPNPSGNEFYLQLGLTEKDFLEITIYDVGGKKVYFDKLEEFSGELKKEIALNASAGVYFIEVTGSKNRFTKKLLVQ